MPFTDHLIDRLRTEIHQQMDGVLALSTQLTRHRLSADAEACVQSVAETALAVHRLMDCMVDLLAKNRSPLPRALDPIRPRDLLDQVGERWERRARDLGLKLLISFDGDPDTVVLGDAGRILQIFDGFIGEACANPGPGGVEAALSVEPAADGVHLIGRVRGGREGGWEDLQDSARFASVEGRMGFEAALGAMLARKIIRDWGGDLRTEAGAGASDTLVFEFACETALSQTDSIEAAVAAPERVHVLVVDDNATNRMVAQSLVEMFECTSETAEDGIQAIEAVRHGRFDLILMDIKMPNMDGVEATRAIRSLPGAIGRVPIIALTANADPDDAAFYLAAGMNGVVEKPMNPQQLLDTLQQVLSSSAEAAAA